MKTYACPFCSEKYNRYNLDSHIEKKHEDMLPIGYTAYRQAYDVINNKPGYGICVMCKKNHTKWNEKRQKYNRICEDPKCIKAVREQYKNRMLKVYNKVHLLDDPKHQEKMLSHRKIAGKYKWSDGTLFEYVGSYEKQLLEFLDKTLEYKSNEIISPGPILEYDHKGVKRHWITDLLILPYNLIVEVKDGQDNPNKTNMSLTREKTIYKEKMITNQGVFNYLRLTNNDFSQLMTILAELKMNVVENDDSKIFRIHEETELLEATNYRYNKHYKKFDDFLKDFNNPHEVMAYLKLHKMNWPDGVTNDKPFAWPDRLLSTEIANCWDYALFFYYFCKNKNIPVSMYRIAMYGDFIDNDPGSEIWTMGHMIAVCKCQEGWYACNYTPPDIEWVHELGAMYGPFKTEEEVMKSYSNIYNYSTRLVMELKYGKKAFHKFYGPYYKKVNNNGLKKFDQYYNNYSINQEDITDKEMGTVFPYDNKVSKYNTLDKFFAKAQSLGARIFHKIGSLFEDIDITNYDELCDEIYSYSNSLFEHAVILENRNGIINEDKAIHEAICIKPIYINKGYTEMFTKISDNIKDNISHIFAENNLCCYQADENNILKGIVIGIEETS